MTSVVYQSYVSRLLATLPEPFGSERLVFTTLTDKGSQVPLSPPALRARTFLSVRVRVVYYFQAVSPCRDLKMTLGKSFM